MHAVPSSSVGAEGHRTPFVFPEQNAAAILQAESAS